MCRIPDNNSTEFIGLFIISAFIYLLVRYRFQNNILSRLVCMRRLPAEYHLEYLQPYSKSKLELN